MPSVRTRVPAKRQSARKPASNRSSAPARKKAVSKYQRTPVTPEIFYIDGFLSGDECREILQELDFAFWRPSLTYTKQPDGKYLDLLCPLRVSRTAHIYWFTSELRALMDKVDRRLQQEFGVDPVCLEDWQATDYAPGGKFDYHLDAGYWADHYAGDRILTFLLYLNTPLKGGATSFRALDQTVQPKEGRLLVWRNLFPDGSPDARMIHSGTPLIKGRKTTLVSWQRQRPYRTANSSGQER